MGYGKGKNVKDIGNVVISLGAGVFGKGDVKPETRKYLKCKKLQFKLIGGHYESFTMC